MTPPVSKRAREYRQISVGLLNVADSALDDGVRTELVALAENYGRLANALETGRLPIEPQS